MKTTFLYSLILGLVFSAGGVMPATAEEDRETQFSEMLNNATLKGTWAPLQGGELGSERKDSYRIARAVKKEGHQWNIVWRVKRQGQVIEYPIPSVVKFAGDTAVLILDEVPIGEGKTWSARVLFHDGTYAGKWWGNGEGGTISGTITQGSES